MSGKPTIERVQVAAMLRSMREEAGITREQSAQALGCTTSKIGDLETGRSAPKVAELDRLLDLYRICGSRARRAAGVRPRLPPPQAAQQERHGGGSLYPTPGSRPGSAVPRIHLLLR